MIAARDYVYAGMKTASKRTASDKVDDECIKYDVDYYDPSGEWIYDPENGKVKFFDTKEEALAYAKNHKKKASAKIAKNLQGAEVTFKSYPYNDGEAWRYDAEDGSSVSIIKNADGIEVVHDGPIADAGYDDFKTDDLDEAVDYAEEDLENFGVVTRRY